MEKLLEMLLEDGYDAEIKNIHKSNGKDEKGLFINRTDSNGHKYGKVYYDVTFKDFFDVVRDFEENTIDYKDVFDKMSEKDRYLLRIRRKIDDDIVTKDFLDLQLYVIVDYDEHIVAITEHNIGATGYTKDELFEYAKENSMRRISASPLGNILGEEDGEENPLFIVDCSNGEIGDYGASVVAFADEVFATSMYIIPSSVHEVITCPAFLFEDDDNDVKYLKDMIKNVNENFLKKEDYLSDNLYYYDSYKKEVSIVK